VSFFTLLTRFYRTRSVSLPKQYFQLNLLSDKFYVKSIWYPRLTDDGCNRRLLFQTINLVMVLVAWK